MVIKDVRAHKSKCYMGDIGYSRRLGDNGMLAMRWSGRGPQLMGGRNEYPVRYMMYLGFVKSARHSVVKKSRRGESSSVKGC